MSIARVDSHVQVALGAKVIRRDGTVEQVIPLPSDQKIEHVDVSIPGLEPDGGEPPSHPEKEG